MEDLIVDLPSPSTKGTFVLLTEFGVVRVGSSSNLNSRVEVIRKSTFRKVALLSWSSDPISKVHHWFELDRITYSRDFFYLSQDLLEYINRCRASLGYSAIDEVQLWEFGGPLPMGGPIEDTLEIPPQWMLKIESLSFELQSSIQQLLSTKKFRSEKRAYIRRQVVSWLNNPTSQLEEFLTQSDLSVLQGVLLNAPHQSTRDNRARIGRYHVHLRWHKTPKSSCEFCTKLENE